MPKYFDSIMKKEEDHLVSGTFPWKIDQFSNLDAEKYYSDVFVIGGFKWYVYISPSTTYFGY